MVFIPTGNDYYVSRYALETYLYTFVIDVPNCSIYDVFVSPIVTDDDFSLKTRE